MSEQITKNQARDIRSSVLHLAIYSVLLVTYFFLVLRYLAGWLLGLFLHHRYEYAIAAIMLMIVQAVVLEAISYSILARIRGKR